MRRRRRKKSDQRAAVMSRAVTGITTTGISTSSQRSSIERPAQMSFQSSRDSLQCPFRWRTSSQGTATITLNHTIRFILHMSARDLARLGVLYLRGGKWRDAQLIPSSWITESTRSYSDVPTGGYGYMWW